MRVKLGKWVFFFLTFHFCIQLSIAQHPKSYLGFHFASEKREQIKIEFRQYNNLIVIPVRINNIDTLNFVLDSGVGYTIITDPTVMSKLKLGCVRKIRVAGTGTGNELLGCITNIGRISLRGIQAFNHNVVVLDEDILHLSSYAGIKIHGLIGYDLFNHFVININYLTRTLTIAKPEKPVPPRKGEVIFPISIEHMKPYVLAEAIVNEKSSYIPIKLILDTGAGHSLALDTGTHPDIQVPSKNISAQLGMTLNGAVEGYIGRIEKFKIGPFEMKKVITAFPDSVSLRFIRGINNRQGNLGCGVLKRFHITFDYPHQRLILKANKRYKEPFDYNISGIELIAEPPNYKNYVVGHVRHRSPGEIAGLRKGDKIIALDDQIAGKMSMGEIYNILNKDRRLSISLLVQRNKGYLVLQLKAKNEL